MGSFGECEPDRVSVFQCEIRADLEKREIVFKVLRGSLDERVRAIDGELTRTMLLAQGAGFGNQKKVRE